MRLVGMVVGHALEDHVHILRDLRTQCRLHDGVHGRIVGLDARRQP